ncbi:endonuclease/exonuclease/phosphatase family protein (macronuclear) [Tetrahymena thermophila SB210]|uniref:Endonuclease/exonuclease/phosphatase family protein n=1 Tax=Tetrahymena thermophila (strain SB210) TaxID=312017 RepID=I7MKU3_TETTS|nr:endonuclease/exonuclease/phosphatase family protein [Tetrahymena thermophila SB210]EAS00322.1 endonuclease/exonuclease/phosphatase family protein [Tetrahymena thermophila SB210]|eukprot:XP_001020567.1 endonuclease/exonuclease/phosphatase family protein [Tetrahymena thermophila SB210]
MQVLASKRINIICYNIHHGADVNDNYNIQKIISTIENQNPDVICLQEVDNNYSERSLNQLQPQILTQQIQGIKESYFSPTIKNSYGILTLSKQKIIDYHTQILTTGLKEDRTFQYLKLQNGLQIIHFHLNNSFDQQRSRYHQLLTIFEILDKKQLDIKNNTIICGDFNEDCDGQRYCEEECVFDLLEQKKFFNAKKLYEQKSGTQDNLYTFSRKYKNINIDHFYVTNDININSFKIIDSDASDHNPIFLCVQL